MSRLVFRGRQNDFVEREEFKLLGRLFHNLGPLTLNLLTPNDLSLGLLGTSFDLADLSFFSDRLAAGTRSRASAEKNLIQFFDQLSASEAF